MWVIETAPLHPQAVNGCEGTGRRATLLARDSKFEERKLMQQQFAVADNIAGRLRRSRQRGDMRAIARRLCRGRDAANAIES